MDERLYILLQQAKQDAKLKEELLATKKAKDPMVAFCEQCSLHGVPITVGELFVLGQEYEDAMIRSVNGGGVDSPAGDWNDMYDMFMSALEQIN